MTRGQESDPHMHVADVEVGQEYVGQVTGIHYLVEETTEASIVLENQQTGEGETYSKEHVQEALNVPTLKKVGGV